MVAQTHRCLSSRWLRAASVGIGTYLSFWAKAESEADVPYFYAQASGGYSVYKSQLVQSNDTSTTVAYGFGGYAGERRTIGFAMMREQGSFGFDLNNSTIVYEFQDFHLHYRYKIVYAGLLISQSSWMIDTPPDLDQDLRPDPDGTAAPVVEALGTGYGVHLGFVFAFWRRNLLAAELAYHAAQSVFAKAIPDTASGDLNTLVEKDVAIGNRIDIDLGARFEMTKRLFGMTGFRYRSMSLESDGNAASELNSTTYLGLRYEIGN